MLRKISILVFSLLVASCSSFKVTDTRVAQVGRDILYESDVIKLLPSGVTSEDSAQMVDQYIEKWALEHLLLMRAKEVLTKEEQDISNEVEDFRRSLLSFKYEKKYVEAGLDTNITSAQIEEYYNTHQNSFKYPYSIVKGRVISISKTSPHYKTILKSYTAIQEDAVEGLKVLASTYAERYEDYGGQWISIGTLAKDVGMDIESCERALNVRKGAGWSYIKSEDEREYFIFLTEKVAPGQLSPIEFNVQKIRVSIYSKRKQDMVKQMEQDLLLDSKENRELIIYNR